MNYNGRADIYTSVELTSDNVLGEVNKALAIHFRNVADENYLADYRKGIQPILFRVKEQRPEICNKIVENHAEEICAFKNGYFLQEPVNFVARNDEASEKVSMLNEYLYRAGKHLADNDLVNDFHTMGKAYLYVEPTDNDEIPFRTTTLRPQSAEVVKSLKPSNPPAFAIHTVADGEDLYVDVFTNDKYFKLFGSINPDHPTDRPQDFIYVTKIIEEKANVLGHIPIIEYRYNETNMGAFESVLDLCDEINTIRSNAVDGIEQFIQNLLVVINVDFEDGVNAQTIRESGMVALKSVDGNKADIKVVSENLNQGDTEVLVKSTLEQIHKIVGMPFVNSGGTSGNVGSAIFVNGWTTADAYAKNTEDEFRKSNRYFEEIMLKILKDKLKFDISISDFELSFTRNELANIQAKAQACGTMIGFGLAPVLALELSGLTNDPVKAYEMSKEFFEAKQNYQGDVTQYGTEETNAYGITDETYGKLENTVLTELGIRGVEAE